MSSMRMYARLISTGSETAGTHCLVEWDEPGNPRNVVARKSVSGDKDPLNAGDVCDVRIQQGAKTVTYKAKLLGCGSKQDMDKMLEELENSSSPEIQLQNTGQEKESQDASSTAELLDSLHSSAPRQSQQRAANKRKQTQPANPQPKKRKTALSKKKVVQKENERMTMELLDGLDCSPPASPTQQSHTATSQQSHTATSKQSHTATSKQSHTATSHPTQQSTNLHPSPLTPSRHRYPFDDITNSSPPFCYDEYASTSHGGQTSTPMLGDSLVGGTLREWMERIEQRILDIHQKVDDCMAMQKEMRAMMVKKKSKKVQFDQCGSSAGSEAVGREESISENLGCENRGPLTVCCGKAGVKGQHIFVELPSEAAVIQFQQVDNCPPQDPAKFALRLLSIFFTEEELGRSNCTRAEGREILNPTIITAIKFQTNLRFPSNDEEARWQVIVVKSLNSKCRNMRKKLKSKDQENSLLY